MKIKIKEIIICLSFLALMSGCSSAEQPLTTETDNSQTTSVKTEQADEPDTQTDKMYYTDITKTDEEDEYVPERIQLAKTGVKGKPEEIEEDGWRIYYSSDKTVYVKQKTETGEAAIVDGDAELPVELAAGGDGHLIEKFDADGDGEAEILIAECEEASDSKCLYGLCIVEKNADGYLLTRYDSSYFAGIIEEKIGVRYNKETRELTVFEILPPYFDRYTGYTLKFGSETNIERVIMSDVIRITFDKETIYLSAPSGYVFEGVSVPDYKNTIEAKIDLRIDTDSNINLGFWIIRPN